MMRFRKKHDPKERFSERSEIQDIIRGKAHENYVVDQAELEKLLEEATQESNADPASLPLRLKKNWAAALLRDYKYSNRNYRFLKGVGLGGMYVENYNSANKIRKIQ